MILSISVVDLSRCSLLVRINYSWHNSFNWKYAFVDSRAHSSFKFLSMWQRFQCFLNCPPCRGFVRNQYYWLFWTKTYFKWFWCNFFLWQKNLISIHRVRLLDDSSNIALLLCWDIILVFTIWHCTSRNKHVHNTCTIWSLTPTRSALDDRCELIFRLVEEA